ncbi:hypothetical protein [Thermococcus sp. 21S7]|uniref:hypothetical protein n=1 Tax=Thermococcus sp. 21S7 TaxID=1638221 RepID=UPI00143B440B|nr:hypothetical protein [Thermococcus sp. 21S7]NJE60833.1 hypothetical protein [Thermococcus sp. 21S7]
MGRKAKVGGIITGWMDGKRCTYAKVRCGILSECVRAVEGVLAPTAKLVRLTDPDLYLLVSSGEDLYDRGKFLTVIELTDGLSRLFYLAASDAPLSLKELPHPEFVLAFRVRGKEGFRALLDVIGRKRVGGIRYKHRSALNFLISFTGGLLLSSAINIEGYWGQVGLTLILAFIIFLVLDYPFSLLYIKGVEVIQKTEPSTKVFVIKVKRAEKKGS